MILTIFTLKIKDIRMILPKRRIIERTYSYFNNFCRLPKSFRQLGTACNGQNSKLQYVYGALSANLLKRLS
jgi:hypothetical protein